MTLLNLKVSYLDHHGAVEVQLTDQYCVSSAILVPHLTHQTNFAPESAFFCYLCCIFLNSNANLKPHSQFSF